MSVHSARLGRNATVGTGTSTIYTVPAMKRTIVKNVLISNNAAAANHVLVSAFNGATLLWSATFYLAAAGTDGDTKSIDLWTVLNSTEQLKLSAGAVSVSLVASGAELDV